MSLKELMNTGLLLVVFSFGVVQPSPEPTLKHVNLVYRHGDRSPNIIFPNDINKEAVWPDGLGWLTNIGKQQQFALGQYLRQRYGGFINVTRYDHRQISIESSAKDRCLMSVQANLAGMFPPEGKQVWDENLGKSWQPIPVHSVPMDEDNKIALHKSCPRIWELYSEMFSSKKATDYEKANQAFFDLMSNNSGWEEKSNLHTTWKIIDPVVCERAHSMKLNDFLNGPGVLEKLDEVQHLSWDMQYLWPEQARLSGGPLLKQMIDNMKTAVSGDSSDFKMHMYSGHDSTVSALLHAMNVDNHMQPPYASLVMVELHQIKEQYVVRIYYRNDTDSDPMFLLPPGCDDPCELSTFEKVLSDRIPKNWEEECKSTATTTTATRTAKATTLKPITTTNNSATLHLRPALPFCITAMVTVLKSLMFI